MAADLNLDIQNRIDFVYLFDVRDGNPNGDPDAGNAPRMDPETGQGLVSDVAIKRKVRDYVTAAKGDEPRFGVYVKLHSALHEQRAPAYLALGLDDSKKGREKASVISQARSWMCQNHFDIRTFGAVMGVTDFNCGQVRGPVQLTFGRSIDPIADLEQAISRKAVERENAETQLANDGFITGTLGRKSIVPYGLYRTHIFYNPHFAKDTGFDQDDMTVFVEALRMMFELDRSATRGQMSAQAIYAFQHSSPLGNAQASKLFERVTVRPRDAAKPPRRFDDYEVSVNEADMPAGVRIKQLL